MTRRLSAVVFLSSSARLSVCSVAVCLGFALGVSSCGPPPCTSATCQTGCCSSTGRCETGTSNTACGRLGVACTACSISQSCSAGTCTAPGFGGGSAIGGGSTAGGSAIGGGSTAGGSAVGGGSTAGGSVVGGGRAGGSANGGGEGGGGGQSCTVSGTCPVNTCRCGDDTVLTSQFCDNTVCQTGAAECSRACVESGYPPPGGAGGGSAGGGSAGGGSAGGGSAGGGSACNGNFVLGNNFRTGSELYVQCNAFPSPTNCLTGDYINFQGLSGPLSACFCYAVCPNGVSAGQVCSARTPDLICTRVRNAAGTSSALMCLPPGAAWQNLCRG